MSARPRAVAKYEIGSVKPGVSAVASLQPLVIVVSRKIVTDYQACRIAISDCIERECSIYKDCS